MPQRHSKERIAQRIVWMASGIVIMVLLFSVSYAIGAWLVARLSNGASLGIPSQAGTGETGSTSSTGMEATAMTSNPGANEVFIGAPKVPIVPLPGTASASRDSTKPVATTTPTVSLEKPGSVSVAAPAASVSAPMPTTVLPSGTFTELFSGTGAENSAATTAYEDYSTTAISLVPAFSVTPCESGCPSAGTSVASAAASTVEATADGYVVHPSDFPNLTITSAYHGMLRTGYDPETKTTLVVYAAYMSHVYVIAADGTVTDYSKLFGQRAFGGGDNGTLAVHPDFFPKDGAWWIYSGEGSTMPKLMKIENGTAVDYTTNAFPSETSLAAAPGPAAHEIYVITGKGTYLLADNGYQQTPVVWVSTKLNDRGAAIVQGEIIRADTSTKKAGGAPDIRYFLSNDGGATWISVAPNDELSFPAAGGDFRFKIVLDPTADPYASPWVDTIGVEYWMKQ